MSSRDEILHRLRAGQRADRPSEGPAAWTTSRAFDNLADRFEQALIAAKGEVHRAPSLAAALTTLDNLLRSVEAEKVVLNDEPPLTGLALAERWPDIESLTVGDPGDLRQFCLTADVGLSGGDAALAETGSIAISSGPGRSRLATLLPPVHIALVPESRLTTDIFSWTAVRQGAGQEALPASVILVSGPSKTADIEQTMAVGVHGPRRFIVILYADS